ncbi:MAG: MJ0042-type zinc finger domain-containing protein [Desulfobacterales bacterium]
MGSPECLRCGIIFEKYGTYLEKKRRLMEEASRTTDGLIDPESIRAAVEESQAAPPASENVKTRCPHCDQRYRIRPDQIGITTRCKKCSSIFKIEILPDS